MKHIILAVLMVLVLGSVACANPYVTATYRSLETGNYRLDFVLYLDQYHGTSYGWNLWTTEITDLAAPAGWRVGTGIRETNWDSISPEYGVLPGGILTGCAGTFSSLPTQLDYFVRLTGPEGGISGTLTPTAAPVPEPSSMLALFGGLASIGGFALRRRK